MKYLTLALFLASCATVPLKDPVGYCTKVTCPAAAIEQETSPGWTASYDPFDDTCLCTFRDGRLYITPRK